MVIVGVSPLVCNVILQLKVAMEGESSELPKRTQGERGGKRAAKQKILRAKFEAGDYIPRALRAKAYPPQSKGFVPKTVGNSGAGFKARVPNDGDFENVAVPPWQSQLAVSESPYRAAAGESFELPKRTRGERGGKRAAKQKILRAKFEAGDYIPRALRAKAYPPQSKGFVPKTVGNSGAGFKARVPNDDDFENAAVPPWQSQPTVSESPYRAVAGPYFASPEATKRPLITSTSQIVRFPQKVFVDSREVQRGEMDSCTGEI